MTDLIEMSESNDLPPEIDQAADLQGRQRPEVHELFWYALVLAMIDDEQAHIAGTRNEGDHEYLTVQAIVGDVFKRNEIEEVSCLTPKWSRAVLRGAVGKEEGWLS